MENKEDRQNNLERIAGELFLELSLKSIAKHKKLDENSRSLFIQAFLLGHEYSEKHPEYLENRSAGDRAFKLASEYLCSPTREHHLSYYFEKALIEQRKIDKIENDKKFNYWIDRALDKCYSICRVILQKRKEDRIILNKKELIKEIKGIEL